MTKFGETLLNRLLNISPTLSKRPTIPKNSQKNRKHIIPVFARIASFFVLQRQLAGPGASSASICFRFARVFCLLPSWGTNQTFDVLELDNQLVGLVYTILLGAASFSLLLRGARCSFTLPFWSSFALGALLLAINRRRSAALTAFRFLCCLCIGIAKIEAEERSMSSTAIVCIIINCWRNAA